jgi:hypothetical protein
MSKLKQKKSLIKIDTHSHTAGASFCSQVLPAMYAQLYKARGIRTTVLTNHYSRQQMSMVAYTFPEQIRRFVDEFHVARDMGKEVGVNVLLGAEVAIASKTSPYNEYILFGLSEEFLLNTPPLYDLDQASLYRLCNDHGILMYQTHPFRHEQGHSPQDPDLMDGVEINCHSLFKNHYEEVVRFADKHNLAISCGSDLHYPTQAGYGGIFADDTVRTERDLARYLRAHRKPKVFFTPKIKMKFK